MSTDTRMPEGWGSGMSERKKLNLIHHDPVDEIAVFDDLEKRTILNAWGVEHVGTEAFLLLNGSRIARMTVARAEGICAALSTPQGDAAFMAGRDRYLRAKDIDGRPLHDDLD